MPDDDLDSDDFIRASIDPRDLRLECAECGDELGVTESVEVWKTVTKHIEDRHGSDRVRFFLDTSEAAGEIAPDILNRSASAPILMGRHLNAMYGLVVDRDEFTPKELQPLTDRHDALFYGELEHDDGDTVERHEGLYVNCESCRA